VVSLEFVLRQGHEAFVFFGALGGDLGIRRGPMDVEHVVEERPIQH
jgi:hypothetical protein